MLSLIASEHFAASPFLGLAVVGLLLFMSVFAAVSVRATLARRDDLEALARLPLGPTMSDEKRRDAIQGEIVHEYDGIEEADNALPRWWLGIFYATVLWSVGYWFYYHELRLAPLPRETLMAQLEAERAAQAKAPKGSDASLAALVRDAAVVTEGRALYEKFCVACHEPQGQGKIGPNLTDRFWIHGGSPTQILEVISKGLLTAGMPGWEAPLGAPGVQKVTAYVISLRDSNVPGKEPQGTPWPPEPGMATPASTPAPSPTGAGAGG